MNSADYALAASRSQQAADLFAQLGDATDASAAINQAGLAYLYGGDYDSAMASFNRALALDAKSGDNDQLIEHLNNSANVYFFRGSYSGALEQYRRALEIANAHRTEPWAARRIALTALNLAVLYEQVGQYRLALENYKAAQAKASNLQPEEYGQLLSNLGTLYRRLGDAPTAISTYREAQRVFADARHADSEIHVLENLGIALALGLHDFDGAIKAFSQALALADHDSNKRQKLLAHLFRAEAFYRKGSFAQSADDGAEENRALQALHSDWSLRFMLGHLFGGAQTQEE